MARIVTICSMQWGDLPLAKVCETMAELGYDGLELGLAGDHFDVEVVSVRLAPLGHGELVLACELLVGDRHHAALGPFVEKPMLKEEGVPAPDAGDFLSLREVPKVVDLHVQMGGSAFQIHQLVTHGAYSTINPARAPVRRRHESRADDWRAGGGCGRIGAFRQMR